MSVSNKKQHAVDLRLEGYSLSYISEKIGVSRASLSHWLRDVSYSPNEFTQNTMNKARTHSATTRSRIRRESIGEFKKKAASDLGSISNRDLLMIGLGLFARSGRVGGGGIRAGSAFEKIELFTSDAKLARLFVLWIQNGLTIPTEYIFVRITVTPSLRADMCSEFWAQALKIPKGQIKIGHIEHRISGNPKFSSAPFGSVKVYLKNQGRTDLGVKLFRKIEAMVSCVANL
jgi:hypothetical protein